jgi:hypothetical protein
MQYGSDNPLLSADLSPVPLCSVIFSDCGCGLQEADMAPRDPHAREVGVVGGSGGAGDGVFLLSRLGDFSRGDRGDLASRLGDFERDRE